MVVKSKKYSEMIFMDILYPDEYHEFFKYQIRMNNCVLGIFKSKYRAIRFMEILKRKFP